MLVADFGRFFESMPRKNGIEYPGVICRVLNRGNYRRELLVLAGEVFEKCLLRSLSAAAGGFLRIC